MSVVVESKFTLKDLAIAYRKAKVDLFYSNNGRYLDLADYEESLQTNLERLRDLLNDTNNFSWINSEFVGGFRLIPKHVEVEQQRGEHLDSQQTHLISSPDKQWESLFSSPNAGGTQATATFRLMSNCSIDMHVVSALWMREVGYELDGILSNSARGNRLRKDRNGEYNDWSLGTFENYLWPYKKWRDDGFDAIESALSRGKDVYCLTADATEFFHNVQPEFLSLESPFWSMLEHEYGFTFRRDSPRRTRVHRVFVHALTRWQREQENLLKIRGITGSIDGLPVGLPASGLVANLALLEFDKIILKEIHPLYYARYVDDVMLVWEDQSASEKMAPLRSVDDVWEWLASKSKLLRAESASSISSESHQSLVSEGTSLRFVPDYHQRSKIVFSNVKNRLYSMGGSTGLNLLTTLRAAADERSSEWRLLPELPASEAEVGAFVSRAKNVDGDAADSLSSLEGISMSRSNFALTLRSFEAFTRNIEHKSWKEQRTAFFRALRDYVLTPSMVFEMDKYFERVFNLALNCGEFSEFVQLCQKLIEASENIKNQAKVRVSGIRTEQDGTSISYSSYKENDPLRKVVLPTWSSHLHETIGNALNRTGRSLPSTYSQELDKSLTKQRNAWAADHPEINPKKFSSPALMLGDDSTIEVDFSSGGTPFEKLFHRDLAEQSFREQLLPTELAIAKYTARDEYYRREKSPLELFDEERHDLEAFLNMVATSLSRRGLQAEVAEDQSAAEWRAGTISGGREGVSEKNLNWPSLKSLWGLVFPTRPFSPAELFDMSGILRSKSKKEVWVASERLRSSLLVSRGYGISRETLRGVWEGDSSERSYITLSNSSSQLYGFLEEYEPAKRLDPSPAKTLRNNVRVAVSMYQTPDEYVAASLHQKPVFTADRYRSLTRLVNETIRVKPRPDYLVLGELAIPPSWFNAISLKLASAGINLIAGVEYIHSATRGSSDGVVHNQVWASLRHTTLGHRTSSTYKQDKREAAHGERDMLDRELRLRLEPEIRWEVPPIIKHDDHHFGMLICSELTNIEHRANFRGRIDTLFVPQWNKDLNTFTALIESAALDIHAHVVQVNNRKYGDTRIRIPAGDHSWKRDVVQLKGGMNDYIVVAELDIAKMRVFQTKTSSASTTYKPLPDGYEISSTRSRLE